jgi:two-component system, cell cycle response regulator
METRILVIEDNEPNLELMSYLLLAFGYTPIKARTGEEGLDAARRESPDLILCDIHLPGIDGHEVARQLKLDPPLKSIPLLAVTALAMVGDRDKVMASGFNGYLAKPIVPETFVLQVEAFLPSERHKRPPQVANEEGENPVHESLPTVTKGTVLVLDDLPANLDVLSFVLESSGYSVLVADTIEKGMDLAFKKIPDIILSDIHLYNENGYDFLKLVKADSRLKSIPFVFVSATGWRTHDRTHALALGAADLILRPIDPPVLLARIEAILRKHRTVNDLDSPCSSPLLADQSCMD